MAEALPVDACLEALRPVGEQTKRPVDAEGFALCKRHMQGLPCRVSATKVDDGKAAQCGARHMERRLRPTCDAFTRYGTCDAGPAECWFPHEGRRDFPLCVCALQTEIRFGHRLVTTCRRVLGDAAVVGVARASLRADTSIVVLLGGSSGADVTLARLLNGAPECVAHLSRCFRLEGHADGAVAEAAGRKNVRVRGFPKAKEASVVSALEEQQRDTLALGGCEFYLDVVEAWGCTYAAVWPAEAHAATFLDRVAAVKKTRQATGALCRASWKLAEALHRSAIPVDLSWAAVDVGAAPGGWSQILSALVETVYAVDPADLSPDLSAVNVHHLKLKAEDAAAHLLLPARGDHHQKENNLRLVVCDANVHPEAVATLIEPVLAAMPDDKTCWCVLSLKNFAGRDQAFQQALEAARLQIANLGFDLDAHLDHLFANSFDERTLWAARPPRTNPPASSSSRAH